MNRFLTLMPHKQFKIGAVILMSYSFIAPYIFFFVSLFVAAASLGMGGGDATHIFILGILFVTWLIIFIVGIVVPIVRMLVFSHKYSKQIGRGDEHVIFYTGVLLVALTWIFTYRPYITTVTESNNSGSTFILLFFTGNILGLLILALGLFTLIRLSYKISNMYDNQTTR